MEKKQPQNRCFLRGFRQFSAHLTKCHPGHGICTSSPLHAALTMRFAKARNATRLKCWACHAKRRWARPKCCACCENCNGNASSANVAKVWRLPHKTISTRYKTPLHVTTCHACRAKRSHATIETSKNDPFCRRLSRGRLRKVANGCGRLRT